MYVAHTLLQHFTAMEKECMLFVCAIMKNMYPYKTVGFTNFHTKVGTVFPYALFLFYKRKISIFENRKEKKVKKYGNQNKKSGQRYCASNR